MQVKCQRCKGKGKEKVFFIDETSKEKKQYTGSITCLECYGIKIKSRK